MTDSSSPPPPLPPPLPQTPRKPSRSTFRPSARLHDDRDYSRVFNRQQKAASRSLVVLVRPRAHPQERGRTVVGRLGVMISVKAVKTAVRRHQLKRWVRELFRLRLAGILAGQDAVVMFRGDPGDDHRALDDEIAGLVTRALASSPQPRQVPRQRDGQRDRQPDGQQKARGPDQGDRR